MKSKEIRDLTSEEIENKVKDLKAELFNLRFQAATGQLDNPMRLSEVRKNIARCKTILHERELKINAGGTV